MKYIVIYGVVTRQIMTYTPSSQYVNDSLVKTENTKTTML